MVALALSVLVTVAAAAGVLVAARAAPPRLGAGPSRHPVTWLAAVTALLLLNQVLFTVYVTREWHGDVARLARYLPDGWFALADLGVVADRFPAPHLLGWTVLRAQAGLELPFVLLAYLTVCRWFGAEVFRRAVAARWAASVTWTVTFCLIEWRFLNPYTLDDLVVRVMVAVAVPPLLVRLAEGPVGPPRVLAWVGSTGALAGLVLLVYDVALLYNLGHLASRLPLAAGALVVLAAARRDHRVAGRLALVAGAGALAAAVGLATTHGVLLEARLLAAAVAAVLAGGGACLALDRPLALR